MKSPVPFPFLGILTSTLTLNLIAEELASPGGPPPTTVFVRSRFVGESSLGNQGATVSFYTAGVSAQVPIPLTRRLSADLTVSGDYIHTEFNDFGEFLPGRDAPMENGAEGKIAPGLSYQFNDRWIGFVGGQWLYAGAAGASVNQASMWGGSLGAVFNWRPGLTLAGGFAVAERIGYSTLYVPFLGVDWRINSRWRFEITGTATDYVEPVGKISFRVDENWTLFGRGGYETRYLRLADDSSIPDGSLRYQAAALQAGFERRLGEHWQLTLYGGAQVGQEFTFRNRNQNIVGEDSTGTSPSVGARLQATF